MEIKQQTTTEAIDRAEQSLRETAEEFGRRLTDQAKDHIAHLRDAAAGIEALNAGLGTVLDRATALFVTSFEVPNRGNPVSIAGACLRFDAAGFVVGLDTGAWNSADVRGPVVKPGARYRVVVLIEPLPEDEPS